MSSQLIDLWQISSSLFAQSTSRIVWNSFLALIPLLLSLYLFRTSALRNAFWWIVLLFFIAFLPNAPYVLTDSMHIIELSLEYPNLAVALVLIPQYTLFIVAGYEAYTISLSLLDDYLKDLIPQYLPLVNAIAHLLCVVGIYIGRFERFNSWDFVTKPTEVLTTTALDLLDGSKLGSMAIAFLVLFALTELLKLVNHRIWQRIENNF